MSGRNAYTEDLVVQAKREHRKARSYMQNAGVHRDKRDVLVRQVYASGCYSYPEIAKRVGVSPELVAKIVQGRPG